MSLPLKDVRSRTARLRPQGNETMKAVQKNSGRDTVGTHKLDGLGRLLSQFVTFLRITAQFSLK
jgi:DNA invertase Pin-like site-specific DNA recombinase